MRMSHGLLILVVLVLTGAAVHGADLRGDLAKAVDYGRNLGMMAQLNPDAEDVGAMLAASRAIIRIDSEYDKAHEAALEAAAKYLDLERKSLLDGTPLPEEAATALEDLWAGEQDRNTRRYQDVDTQLRLLAGKLSATVNQSVDWAVPPDLPAPPAPDVEVERLRALANRVDRAAGVIENIRHLDAALYVTTRVQRLSEFLRGYGYEVDSPEYKQAVDFMFRLTDEARLVREDQWVDQRTIFAARVLMYLGDLGEGAAARQDGRPAPHNWWDMYHLLGDPQTPGMLSKVLTALKATEGDGK